MAILTYDGSAKDHDTIPQVLKKRDRDGKTPRRQFFANVPPGHKKSTVKKAAVTLYKPLATYDLRGWDFPKGKPQETKSKDLIKKAAALGCFKIEISPDEPIAKDKKWLDTALEAEDAKVVMAGKGAKAPAAKKRDKKKAAEHSDDGLDGLKREELVRMAKAQGVSVHPKMGEKKLREEIRVRLAADQDDPGDPEDTEANAEEDGDEEAEFMDPAGFDKSIED